MTTATTTNIITDQGALNTLRMFIDSLPADIPGRHEADTAVVVLAKHHAERRVAHVEEGRRL